MDAVSKSATRQPVDSRDDHKDHVSSVQQLFACMNQVLSLSSRL